MQQLRSQLAHLPYTKLIAKADWLVLFLALGAYMYFLATAVVHVVFREELVVDIKEERARIAVLEAEYLSRVADLSESAAHDLGLVAATPIAYVELETATRLTHAR